MAFVLVVMSWTSGCARRDLSEPPPVDGTARVPVVAAQPSEVGALLTLPLAAIVKAADAALPRSHREDWADGGDACVNTPRPGQTCAGTRYRYKVRRGELTAVAEGTNAVRLRTEIEVDGAVGLRGKAADVMGLDARPFKASATVELALTPSVNSDWCLVVDVVPSYRWIRQPRIEVLPGFEVNVSMQVDRQLKRAIPVIAEAARSAIDCADWRARLGRFYTTATVPLRVTPDEVLHLNLTPLGFALSGLEVDADGVRMAARMTLRAEVDRNPIALTPLPLPPMHRIGANAPPRTRVQLPLRVPIALLEERARRELVGKTFSTQTPAGSAAITVQAIRLYPTTGGRVAIGLGFSARLPGQLFNTRSTVYLVGTPALDEPTVVRLDRPVFTRVLDNTIWNTASALFDGVLREEMARQLRYDFAPDVERGRRELARVLADPATAPGARLSVAGIDAGLGRIAIDGVDLVAEVLLLADITVEPDLSTLARRR